ncbi:MAG: hypothetical protein K0V04_33970 [Deltaproteobacteria bacterium]|nr:hypothetical protein [Deltaproteobacteria bacterium]
MHAAAESSPGNLPVGTRAVVLAAVDEAHLVDIERRLLRLGIHHRAIREPDPPWSGALMAVGLAPVVHRTTVRTVTARLRLLQ